MPMINQRTTVLIIKKLFYVSCFYENFNYFAFMQRELKSFCIRMVSDELTK